MSFAAMKLATIFLVLWNCDDAAHTTKRRALLANETNKDVP